jgi:hypothetical protein
LLFSAMERIFCHSIFFLSVCQVAEGSHFVFNGVVRGVVNGCVCGSGFTEYVYLNFVVLSDEK